LAVHRHYHAWVWKQQKKQATCFLFPAIDFKFPTPNPKFHYKTSTSSTFSSSLVTKYINSSTHLTHLLTSHLSSSINFHLPDSIPNIKMKYSFVLVAGAFAVSTVAQSVGSLPSCGVSSFPSDLGASLLDLQHPARSEASQSILGRFNGGSSITTGQQAPQSKMQ
jgi:hypothetical protein